MLKKSIICCAMIGAVAVAVASSGGGDKRKSEPLKPEFTPIRTTNGFTLSLKSGSSYMGSNLLSSERKNNLVMYKTLVTYQKGNAVYILPQQIKVNVASSSFKPSTLKSNLNLLDLRINLHK
ncbi:MAG: hypothetical protein QM731_00710 [Chitinophagaceae bacterium]